MARAAHNPMIYEYRLPAAALDRRTSRKRLREGSLSLDVGVDGRYTGGLKKFPGMIRLHACLAGKTGTTPLSNVKFCKYASIQKGTTGYMLRGFIVLHEDWAGYQLTYFYFDEDPGGAGAAWEKYDFTGFVEAAGSIVDCGGSSKFLYVVMEGQNPRVLWNTAGAGVDAAANFGEQDMGPGTDYDAPGDAGLLAPTDGGLAGGGYLDEGEYDVAYRYYDSTRGVYSAISSVLTKTVAAANQKLTITNPDAADPDRAYDQGYDKLQVFRSQSVQIAGSAYAAGLLYLETEYDLDAGADCWPAAVEAGIERDEALFYSDVYDPERDVSGSPPQGGAVLYVGGITFIGADASAGSVLTQVQWSPLHRDNPEAFPITGHTFRWSSDDGHVLRFTQAGDMIYVMCENAAYRIARNGSLLVISRMHGGRGITNRNACHEVGRDIMAVTHNGVGLFDGNNGAFRVIGALDRIVYDDWRGDWGYVFTASDPAVGASIIGNPVTGEAVVVWHVTGAITMLDDFQFVAATTGPHPVDGGASRAWLITDTGIICGIDLGVVGSGTMLGIDNSADLNGDGATVSYTANTMTDTAATLHASMEGAYIHVYHAATQTYERRLISGVNVGTDTLTVGAAWTLTPAAGSRYTISPIPYKLRLWPLPSPAAPAETGRKLVRDMALNVTGYAGVAGNPNAVWRVGVCRNGEAEPSAEIEEVGMAVDPQDQHANVNRDGHMLEPWVENISAGTDFELLNVTIDATITGSRKIG